jgi:hypothetical protein
MHVTVFVAMFVVVCLQADNEVGNNHNAEASSGVVAVGVVAMSTACQQQISSTPKSNDHQQFLAVARGGFYLP